MDQARYWIDDRFPAGVPALQAQLLRFGNRLQATARLPWPERPAAVASLAAEQFTWPEPYRYCPIQLEYDLGVVQCSRARGQCAVVAVAAERYRLRRGHWPESLAAVEPDLLPIVPTDPFDGRPLRYRRLADGVVVYSVGPNGVDDGGTDLRDLIEPREGEDVGFRLWDVPHRGQPPPAP